MTMVIQELLKSYLQVETQFQQGQQVFIIGERRLGFLFFLSLNPFSPVMMIFSTNLKIEIYQHRPFRNRHCGFNPWFSQA